MSAVEPSRFGLRRGTPESASATTAGDGHQAQAQSGSRPPALCSRRELAVAVAFIALLALVFYAPLFQGKTLSNVPNIQRLWAPWQHGKTINDRYWVGSPGDLKKLTYPQGDQATDVYPNVNIETRAWRDGTVPLWNPYNFGGMPLLANGGAGVMYPLRIVLSVLVSPSVNHDLFLLLHLFLSGLFMFLLMKEFRLRFAAALLAAAAWMFAGFNVSWMGVEVFTAIVTWFPLALLLVHRAAATRSWRLACATGVPLGLMALGGSAQNAAFGFAVCGAYGVVLAFWPPDHPSYRPTFDRRLLVFPALAVGFGAALAAVTLLPTLANAGQGGRDPTTYALFAQTKTISVSEFKHVLHPGGPFVGTLLRDGVFVGLVPLALAFVGFFRRRPGAGLGRGLAVGTFFFAIGAPVITLLVYHLVPGTSRLTTTGYMLWLFTFGVIVLAALGLDGILSWVRPVAVWIRGRGLDLVRFVPALAVIIAVVALAGTAGQLIRYARYINPPFEPRRSELLYPATPAVVALQRDRARRPAAQPQRLIGFTALLGDQAAVFALEDSDGYDAVVGARVRSLWRAVEGFTSVDEALRGGSAGSFLTIFYPETTRLYMLPRVGVTTMVARPTEGFRFASKHRSAPPQYSVLYAGNDAQVFNLAGDTPRAWVVHEADVAHGASDALHRFAAPTFDYRNRMVIEPDQGLGPAGSSVHRGTGPSTVARRVGATLNGTSFDVTSSSPGWLVMADVYAPGWQVTVNGHSEPLLRANYTFRAVQIPKGHARVVLKYRAPGFALGLATSIAAVLALVGIAVVPAWIRRRTRAARP